VTDLSSAGRGGHARAPESIDRTAGDDDLPPTAAGARHERRATRPGARTVLRCELVKLGAQVKVRAGFAVCLLGPLAAAVLFGLQNGLPKDTLFGRHLHESGMALPMLLLGFAGTWVLPLLATLVAGDVFSSEDGLGTWKTVLTRSTGRRELFAGKVLAAVVSAVGLVAVAAASSVVAGLLLSGWRPLTGLGGQPVSAGHAALLTVASWLTVLPPVLGFVAIGCLLSVVTRTSVAGVGVPVVLGLVMTVVALVDGIGPLRYLLLTTGFSAWHGLWLPTISFAAVEQQSLVALGWALVCLPLARRSLIRRDVTED